MGKFLALIGSGGIVVTIGFVVFLFGFKYSLSMFDWIERKTTGTRDYIMEKLEVLFIETKPEYVTYALLFCSAGLGFITLAVLALGVLLNGLDTLENGSTTDTLLVSLGPFELILSFFLFLFCFTMLVHVFIPEESEEK